MFNEQLMEELKSSLDMELYTLIEVTVDERHLIMYNEDDTVIIMIVDLEDDTQAVGSLEQARLRAMDMRELNRYINHVWYYGFCN